LLESLNVSNNKLTSLRRIEQLPNLKVLDASQNNISQLNPEVLDMMSIETVYLMGNPIANSCPSIAKIEGNATAVKKAFEKALAGAPIPATEPPAAALDLG